MNEVQLPFFTYTLALGTHHVSGERMYTCVHVYHSCTAEGKSAADYWWYYRTVYSAGERFSLVFKCIACFVVLSGESSQVVEVEISPPTIIMMTWLEADRGFDHAVFRSWNMRFWSILGDLAFLARGQSSACWCFMKHIAILNQN